jgi:AcrR family transcriptional regulator
MARWEPNARERLQQAALELFLERGYDNTTAAQIAERAGLAKSSFFRHFTDKREVLFGGQEKLSTLFADAITGAPTSATPMEAIAAAVQAAAEAPAFDPERRAWNGQRQVVIDSTSELRERDLLKRAGLTDVMAVALRQRGVPEPAASLAAELGHLAFRNAFDRWIDPADEQKLAEHVRQELDELRAAAATLS